MQVYINVDRNESFKSRKLNQKAQRERVGSKKEGNGLRRIFEVWRRELLAGTNILSFVFVFFKIFFSFREKERELCGMESLLR